MFRRWRFKRPDEEARIRGDVSGGSHATLGSGSPAVEPLEARQLLTASLTAAFVSNLPVTLPTGEATRVAVHIANQGDAPTAGPLTVALYASTDNTLDERDVPLATLTRNVRLRPGKGLNVSLRATAPVGTSAGSYTLLGVPQIGDPRTVPAAAAASATPVQITPAAPDLVAGFVSLPNRPVFIGDDRHPARAKVQVTNVGNGTADGSVEVRFYLSADNQLDSTDAAAGVAPARSLRLRTGRGKVFCTSLIAPAGTPAGVYYVLAVADSLDGVAEADETNNLVASSVPVQVSAPSPFTGGRHHHGHDHYGSGGLVYLGSGGYDESGYDYFETPADYYPDDGGDETDSSSGASGSDFDGGGATTEPSDDGGGDSGGDDFGGGDADVGGDDW